MTGSSDSKRLLPRGRATMRLALAAIFGVWLVIVIYLADPFGWSSAAAATADDFNPRKVIPRPMRPITDVPLMSAKKADQTLNPAELVIGVVLGNEARAYPVNMLTGPRREIINDRLGGRAIAATW